MVVGCWFLLDFVFVCVCVVHFAWPPAHRRNGALAPFAPILKELVMMRRHGSVDRMPSTPNTPSRPLRRIHSRTLSNMSDIMADMRYLPLRKKSFWYLYLTTLFLSYLVLLLFTDAGLAFTWLNLGHVSRIPVLAFVCVCVCVS